MPRSTSHTRRLAVFALLFASFAAFSAAPASASVCAEQTDFSQVFRSLDGDESWYTLFAGGDFESGTPDWTFSGGAQVVKGDAFRGEGSVVLPPNGSVTTSGMCVSHGYPHARMYARTDVPSVKNDSSLTVQMLYTDVNQKKQAKSLGKVTQLATWSATKKMSLSQGQLDNMANRTIIRLRFTADARSTWRLDNIYMDPRMRG